MKSTLITSALAATVLCIALNACTLLREANSSSDEQTLIAAGFQARPADTPAKLAVVQSLPPYKVVPRQTAGRVGYVYAAPDKSMIYVGSAAEYQKYEQLSIQQDVAEENEMAAMDNEMSAEDWDWDPWGPYWW